MLSALEARGIAAGVAAADAARARVAAALRDAVPGIEVSVEGADVVLTGRVSADDARLRWIGSLLL